MRILFATFASGSDFLRSLKYNRRRQESTLAVRTKARFSTGQELIVEVGFPGLPNRVLLRVQALETSQRFPGQKFLVLKGEEHRLDFLSAVASGKSDAQHRQHRRFPIRIPARFFVNDAGSYLRGDAITRDVTPVGVALETYRLVPEDADVTVILDCEGGVSLEFTGQVTWSKREDGQATIGVRFARGNGDDQKRLRWLLRDVKGCGRTFEGEVVVDPLPAPVAGESPAAAMPGNRSLAHGTPSSGSRLPEALVDQRYFEGGEDEPGTELSAASLHLEDEDDATFREDRWP